MNKFQGIVTTRHLDVSQRAFHCEKCKVPAANGSLEDEGSIGEVLRLTCQKCSNHWYMCMVCNSNMARINHTAKAKHKENYAKYLMAQQCTTTTKTKTTNTGVVSLCSQEPTEAESIIESVTPPMVVTDKSSAWYLVKTMNINRERATALHIMDYLPKSMILYWAAENAATHGGVQYLTTRAFQKSEMYSKKQLANKEESIWHFRCFVQYMSMSEKQKSRQAGILNDDFIREERFVNTHIPRKKELHTLYGTSNQHTLWNNLPIPPVENIKGIAYINPVNILRYLLAFATEMDPFSVTTDEEVSHNGATYYVTQSAFAIKWKKEFLEKFPTMEALLIWVSDWRDAFGSNRTKQNRKSTVAWTITFSTTRGRINSIDNTRVIALGHKKNEAWPEVEHRFEEDMRVFENGLKVFYVYHGGIEKIIPCAVRRFVCLTDKVERAEYTSTMGCTSTYHRCFGTIIQIDEAEVPDTQAVQKIISDMKDGSANNVLRQYDWSSSMLGGDTAGSLLPACHICRKNNVEWLKRDPKQRHPAIEGCDVCANWKVNSLSLDKLGYPVPPDYPKSTMSMLNPPNGVTSPDGRAPIHQTLIGESKLFPIKCCFATMKQGTRFAFFNAMCPARKERGWNQAVTKSYLRTLCINEAQQVLIYKAAKKAHDTGQVIDWDDPYYVGDYRFPAAWVADLEIPCYIELLMHLLFLGIASTCFDQCSVYLAKINRMNPFKKNANKLLHFLHGFNLSWLLVYPFGGTKLTTGAWVSENWLAWVRVSKITFAYCGQEGVKDERLGCNDVIRMVSALAALVSRVMSHAGCDEQSIRLVDGLVREFLSCVRELDVRNTNGKGSSGTWIKSNYASLVNLMAAMRLFGPLTNFWDGGGKGERYIQEIKPYLPRGSHDGLFFLVRVLERVFKFDCIRLIEKDLFPEPDDVSECGSDSSSSSGGEDSENLEGMVLELDDNCRAEGVIIEDDLDEEGEEKEGEVEEGESNEWSTPMEQDLMSKARVFYIYKSLELLSASIANNEPIAGVVVGKLGQPQLFAMYRIKKSTRLGWKKLDFSDNNGISVGGSWYASLAMSDTELEAPKNKSRVAKVAELSAVAIPLKYGVGEKFMLDDQNKYCVITNTWRERTANGHYNLPSLPFELYQDT